MWLKFDAAERRKTATGRFGQIGSVRLVGHHGITDDVASLGLH